MKEIFKILEERRSSGAKEMLETSLRRRGGKGAVLKKEKKKKNWTPKGEKDSKEGFEEFRRAVVEIGLRLVKLVWLLGRLRDVG